MDRRRVASCADVFACTVARAVASSLLDFCSGGGTTPHEHAGGVQRPFAKAGFKGLRSAIFSSFSSSKPFPFVLHLFLWQTRRTKVASNSAENSTSLHQHWRAKLEEKKKTMRITHHARQKKAGSPHQFHALLRNPTGVLVPHGIAGPWRRATVCRQGQVWNVVQWSSPVHQFVADGAIQRRGAQN